MQDACDFHEDAVHLVSNVYTNLVFLCLLAFEFLASQYLMDR